MMPEANKRALLILNKVAWNWGDVSRIGAFIHDDFIAAYRRQLELTRLSVFAGKLRDFWAA
jgi:hypothetical protein